jgi:hypothetical protein
MKEAPLSLVDAAREFSNDYDLGEYLRHAYQGSLNTSEVHEMIREYPNSYELGKVARSQSLNS